MWLSSEMSLVLLSYSFRGALVCFLDHDSRLLSSVSLESVVAMEASC